LFLRIIDPGYASARRLARGADAEGAIDRTPRSIARRHLG